MLLYNQSDSLVKNILFIIISIVLTIVIIFVLGLSNREKQLVVKYLNNIKP